MIAPLMWRRNQKIIKRKEPKMGPLFNHQDNSFFYCPGNEPVKTGYNNDPMKWDQTWYVNNKTERSSI